MDTSTPICRLKITQLQRSVSGKEPAQQSRAERLRAVATPLQATPAQAAIAWVAAQGRDIIPLFGARDRSRLTEALGSVDLELTASDLSHLSAIAPNGAAAGDAFPAHQRRAGADG
jgi:aryl-alcohol dehydrogenase-like predicted oxidoreductase